MNERFMEKMKKALLKLKEEILLNLASENEDFKALLEDLDPKDLVDVASDDIDRKTLETLSANDVKRIKLIENALSRINNGRYGLCIKCGKKIPNERLEAIPYTFMCIDCKSSDERKQR